MSFFNRRKKEKGDLIFTNYKVTWQPYEYKAPELEKILEKVGLALQRKDKRIIQKLLKYIEQYPEEPVFKNYLFLAYQMNNQPEAADLILQETIEKHPNYIYGKLNYAASFFKTGEVERIPEVLGEFLEIQLLYPDQDTFHFGEVMSFNKISALYFLSIGNTEQAEIRLNIMKQLDPDNPGTKLVEEQLFYAKEWGEHKSIIVDSFPTVVFESTTKPPMFQNQILEELYHSSEEGISKKLIDDILTLPRESLIKDLELILVDSIRRYHWFEDTYEAYDSTTHDFPVHAFYFLAELKATESLDTILNVFRQGEELLDYWYSDQIIDLLLEPLYLLGEKQLDKLKAFVLEPNLYAAARVLIANVAEQVALHQPERREEVIQWFSEVYQYHLDHPEDNKIIDSTFLSHSIVFAISLRGKELTPLIKKLYAANWIEEFMVGTVEEVIEELNKKPDPSFKNPMPENIHDHYSKKYLGNQEMPNLEQEDYEMLKDLEKDGLLNDFIRNIVGDEASDKEIEKFAEDLITSNPNENNQSSNKKPKIGRNDPCPCGSGRKYKKCCLNK